MLRRFDVQTTAYLGEKVMGTTLLTRDIHTDDITIMSNVSSVTVEGIKVSRLGGHAKGDTAGASAVHIDFEVKPSNRQSEGGEATESMCMVLGVDDAVELGMMLVAMGLEQQSPEEISETLSRLNQLIQDCAAN